MCIVYLVCDASKMSYYCIAVFQICTICNLNTIQLSHRTTPCICVTCDASSKI